MPTRVVAVVVTRDRSHLLHEALLSLRAQTCRPDVVVVVDNASSDGTPAMVAEEFPEVDLLAARRNTGGAGGFALGLRHALRHHDAGLLWLMDDDCLPSATALEALLQAWSSYPGPTPALVASRVLWTDGTDHAMNTPRRAPLASGKAVAAAAAVGCTPVRSASFVSVLVDGTAAAETGLPLADYFLWNDDFEYTTRLLRGRPGLHCPASVVVHRSRTSGDSSDSPGPRFYYEVRNKVWLLLRSPGLSPVERVLYGGSSVRRWARTLLRSSRRRDLVRDGWRGLRHGLAGRPRDTDAVLAGALEEPA